MFKALFLAVLLGLIAASAADFPARPPYFRHKPVHEPEPMPSADAPRPHWPFPEHRPPHHHENGPSPTPGPFAHPPRLAGAPDHMPHHHHHRGHHFPGDAQPPMMGHGHAFHGKTMPPAHAPHMHPRHHEPFAPAY